MTTAVTSAGPVPGRSVPGTVFSGTVGRARVLVAALGVMVLMLVVRPADAQFKSMGPVAFGGAYDQPFVQVTLYDGQRELGPDPIRKNFLLDTGANGILVVGDAAADLHRQGDFQQGYFEEIGVGGTILYNVSAPYTASIQGMNSSVTLNDVRVLSDPLTNFGQFVPFEGLVGMPALVNRVTTLDMSTGNAGLPGEIDWSNIDDLIDLLLGGGASGIGVSFHDELPASNGHRAGVPVRALHFDHDQGDVDPTYAPLGVVTAEVYTNCQTSRHDNYIIDTGAQLSFISLDVVRSLGLDPNEPFGQLTISGVGGTRTVPTFLIEELRLPTGDGHDLVWYGAEVIGLDIHESIDGVIGSDLLTAGMVEIDFTATEIEDMIKVGQGPIRKVHFDFRDLDQPTQDGTGTMYFDLSETADRLIVPGDANMDGKVDQADVQVLVGNWGEQFPVQIEDQIFYGQEVADFNYDCRVDVTDLTMMAENWQHGVSMAAGPLDINAVLAAVPEPSAAVLSLLGTLAILVPRRRVVRG